MKKPWPVNVLQHSMPSVLDELEFAHVSPYASVRAAGGLSSYGWSR
jgi:hypothetical protein